MSFFAQSVKILPNKLQADLLCKSCGCARFAYNWGLNKLKQHKEETGKILSAYDIKKLFTEEKQKSFKIYKREFFETRIINGKKQKRKIYKDVDLNTLSNDELKVKNVSWLYDVPADILQESILNLGSAVSKYFSWFKNKKGPRVGFPRFKTKKSDKSFRLTNQSIKIISKNVVFLTGFGNVKYCTPIFKGGTIQNATVKLIGNDWYLQICFKSNESPNPILYPYVNNISQEKYLKRQNFDKNKTKITGVDLGIRTQICTSDGNKFVLPKSINFHQTRINTYQKKLSRCKKFSKNYEKTVKKLRSSYQKQTNIKKDFYHKITTQLCRENKAIVIEDLKIEHMKRNKKLSASFQKISLGNFKRLLLEKSAKFECNVYQVDKFFPSTQICCKCFSRKTNENKLSLSDKIFKCSNCGFEADRDENAAKSLAVVLDGRTPDLGLTELKTLANVKLISQTTSVSSSVKPKNSKQKVLKNKQEKNTEIPDLIRFI
jgi:putative transposase